MQDSSDNRPFPIQAENGGSPCTIPWWLAEHAYAGYVKLYGKGQSLERIAERGGFGRNELIDLLNWR